MSSITEYMLQDHRDCDDLFVLAENAAQAGDWADAAEYWKNFQSKMNRHFDMEEEVLFPAFEAATGNTEGPTVVMRMEHEQIRGLMAGMAKSLETRDQEFFLGLTESLLVLIQQHNMKEEQILYPMSDRALSDAESVLASMQALG